MNFYVHYGWNCVSSFATLSNNTSLTLGDIFFMATISVVLSTYNGARYILELMDSLRLQTRQPDEVLILDDGSTDETVSIVEKYISSYHLSHWEFRPSKVNVGWRANFRRGILACRGEYIFPCDQDDIWSLDKIALMAREMEIHPEINLLACEVQPFYEGKSERYRADKAKKSNKTLEFVDLAGCDFLYTLRPGCAHCIRKEFAHTIAPWWKESYPHDATLWRFAALTGSLALYNMQLVNFRRHGDNASSRGEITKKARIGIVSYYIDFFSQVRDFLENKGLMSNELDELLINLNKWFESRTNVLSGKMTIKDLREILCVGRKWYSSWRGPLVDIYFAIKPSGSLHV